MTQTLPSAEVVRTYIDESFDPYMPVLVLRWEGGARLTERLWELPEGLCVVGGAPRLLGVRIRRESQDGYQVRLMWEGTLLSWPALSRVEILASCLSPVLGALGVDLWSLLEQPLPGTRIRQRAA
jgi:hypothetical protein